MLTEKKNPSGAEFFDLLMEERAFGPASSTPTRKKSAEGGGISGNYPSLAGGAARNLGRPGTIHAAVLVQAEYRDMLSVRWGERSSDGFPTLLGMVDDVLNVPGHCIGTMEVESDQI